MANRLEAARAYVARGWRPIPIPSGTKAPSIKNWPSYKAEPWDLDRDFTGDGNIGLLCGEPSNLIDIDIDAAEAVALADIFLPATDMVHGRSGKPRSHRWYICSPIPATRKYADVPGSKAQKAMLVEVRSTGAQTVVPCSMHPDSNEPIVWDASDIGQPAEVSPDVLFQSVGDLAATVLLARHWPAEGGRHALALSLSGAMARASFPVNRILRIIGNAARLGGDPEVADRERAAKDTVASVSSGKKVTGIPSIKEIIPALVVDRLVEWLGLGATATMREEPEMVEERVTLGDVLKSLKNGMSLRDAVILIGPSILNGDLSEGIARPALLGASGLSDAASVYDRAMDEVRAMPVEIPRLSHKDPEKTAAAFIKYIYSKGNHPTLYRWRGSFYRWTDGSYKVVAGDTIRAQMSRFMSKGMLTPNSSRLSNAIDLLNCRAHLDESIEPPSFLGGIPKGYPDPATLVPLRSGLLEPGSRNTWPITPQFFNLYALPFDYNPDDAKRQPTEWLAFLKSVWPEDSESIDTLQEIMGYLLTPDNSFGKAFLIVGPTRSGKGTIAHVIRKLLGNENVAGPSMSALATNFGCSSLLGKTCAIVADAHTSQKTDNAIVADRILNISGNDPIDIDRKNLPIVTVQLRCRMVVMSNEIPYLLDNSAALPNRFIILHMKETFLGREDYTLLDRLTPEIPLIMHWALAGRQRLYERGGFVMPPSGRALMDGFIANASPIKAFLRECCKLRSEASIPLQSLFALWANWCRTHGRDKSVGSDTNFSLKLTTAEPTLHIVREWKAALRKKVTIVYGIEERLPEEGDEED